MNDLSVENPPEFQPAPSLAVAVAAAAAPQSSNWGYMSKN